MSAKGSVIADGKVLLFPDNTGPPPGNSENLQRETTGRVEESVPADRQLKAAAGFSDG